MLRRAAAGHHGIGKSLSALQMAQDEAAALAVASEPQGESIARRVGHASRRIAGGGGGGAEGAAAAAGPGRPLKRARAEAGSASGGPDGLDASGGGAGSGGSFDAGEFAWGRVGLDDDAPSEMVAPVALGGGGGGAHRSGGWGAGGSGRHGQQHVPGHPPHPHRAAHGGAGSGHGRGYGTASAGAAATAAGGGARSVHGGATAGCAAGGGGLGAREPVGADEAPLVLEEVLQARDASLRWLRLPRGSHPSPPSSLQEPRRPLIPTVEEAGFFRSFFLSEAGGMPMVTESRFYAMLRKARTWGSSADAAATAADARAAPEPLAARLDDGEGGATQAQVPPPPCPPSPPVDLGPALSSLGRGDSAPAAHSPFGPQALLQPLDSTMAGGAGASPTGRNSVLSMNDGPAPGRFGSLPPPLRLPPPQPAARVDAVRATPLHFYAPQHDRGVAAGPGATSLTPEERSDDELERYAQPPPPGADAIGFRALYHLLLGLGAAIQGRKPAARRYLNLARIYAGAHFGA